MKRYLKMIGLGVGLGIGFLIIQYVFKIEDSKMMNYYIVFGVIIIAIATVYSVVQMKKDMKLLQKFSDGISNRTVDGNLLSEVEEFENKKKSQPKVLNLVYTNRSVYYGSLKKYDKALEELDKVEYKLLSRQNKLIYLNNKIEYLMEIEEDDLAKEVYKKNKSYIEQNIHLISSISGINFGKFEKMFE